MKRLWLGISIVVVVGAASGVVAQRDFSEIEIETTHVAGNVYMLKGAGGNIGVSVGMDGVLLVDDQYAPMSDKIRAALAELSKGDLGFVLNTHWHGDHVGGNPTFGPEAPIIAHTNVRKRLTTPQHVRARTIDPLPKEGWPVITFDDSLSIHFNDEEIKAIHFPHGHTDGDTVVFFTGSNVVHMGDDFWSGMFPFVDLESGGSVTGLTENIAKILETLPADTKVIPGHGSLSTVDGVETFHEMLVKTTAIVRKRIDEGKSLFEIKEDGLPEEYGSWGEGFINVDRWIETIYADLTAG